MQKVNGSIIIALFLGGVYKALLYFVIFITSRNLFYSMEKQATDENTLATSQSPNPKMKY